VSAGSDGALYPLGAGLLDENEVPALAAALSPMSKSTPPRADDSSIRLVDTEFHADSIRMGTVRTGNDALAYVQVAPTDSPRFALSQECPSHRQEAGTEGAGLPRKRTWCAYGE